MIVGILKISLMIPEANSLKDKRRIISSFKAKLKNKFNIAAAETDFQEKWQRSEIALVSVSNDKRHCESELTSALNYAEKFSDLQLVDSEIELM